jgi:hypothetical protein
VTAARPQPVLDLVGDAAELATRVSAVVKAVGAVLVLLGVTTDAAVSRWAIVAGLIVVAVGELVTWIYTRVKLHEAAVQAAGQVTPLADPQDNRGVPLVPVDSYGRHAAPNA